MFELALLFAFWSLDLREIAPLHVYLTASIVQPGNTVKRTVVPMRTRGGREMFVKVVSTFDAATAREWSIEMFGEGNPVPFFLAPHRFGVGERTKDSLAITLTGAHCYGMGMGPEPREPDVDEVLDRPLTVRATPGFPSRPTTAGISTRPPPPR